MPEECYPQTVLANTPEMKLSNNILRYIDWMARTSNPKRLTEDDLDNILTSKVHFARKLEMIKSQKLADLLDKQLF